MKNLIIKQKIREEKIFTYEVADELQIHENTLYRLFRKPLSTEDEQRIMQAIEQVKLKKERNQHVR
ncbi:MULTISPECIES: hypothetical protein [Bacillus]|uniref:hypothetical protein n=1 Tax=Bacillaceae TaxID=186817 RepID=UPI0007B0938A|nr:MULTISPECIES: hypothetical protein [Bacillus]KZN99985.1 hypothetical protein A4244_03540 [Bacillus badius]OCS86150.1 hypothetical protein A6M11_03540 [Bacillus badius]OVE52389.1 hypothetical protein B1A98_08345 [Bacillus badius]TDW04124.1 hypothetical protein B0G66_103425 [Bacillus badius]